MSSTLRSTYRRRMRAQLRRVGTISYNLASVDRPTALSILAQARESLDRLRMRVEFQEAIRILDRLPPPTGNKAPKTADAAQYLYDLMDDVTKKEATELVRTIRQGFDNDRSVEAVARALKQRLGFDDARAQVVAQTELTRFKAIDTITEEQKRVATEGRKRGFVTFKAGEGSCDICLGYDGRRFTLAKASGVIPVHPNCTCEWVTDDALDTLEPAANASFFASCKRDDKGRCMAGTGGFGARMVDHLVKYGAMAAHAEHLAKDWVTDGIGHAVSKLPGPAQVAVRKVYAVSRGATSAAFATYKIGQALAERVAMERGYPPETARRLRGVLAGLDVATLKPVQIGLAASGAGAAVLGAASFVPVATTGYLAYSTARNPLATARAAYGMVKDYAVQGRDAVRAVRRRLARNAICVNAADLTKLLTALELHDYDDWFIALLSVAIDQTQDVEQAIMIAEDLWDDSPTENVFCATGQGGGVDPSCSPGQGGGPGESGRADAVAHAEVNKRLLDIASKLPPSMANLTRSEFRLKEVVVFDSADELRKSGKVSDATHAEASYDRATQTLYTHRGTTDAALAHELGHVLDGPSRSITTDSGFVRAARKEAGKLSDYAKTAPEEALAELLRTRFEEGGAAAKKKAPGMVKALASLGYKDWDKEPKKLKGNVFCKTGKGGGQDPHCKVGTGGKGGKGGKGKQVTPAKDKPPTSTKPNSKAMGSRTERDASLRKARDKIANAPVPGKDRVAKMRAALAKPIKYNKQAKALKKKGHTPAEIVAKLGPPPRPGGDARGNSNDRKRRAKMLFEEFGGAEKGYIVCPWTGIKMHYTDDKAENPKGYPKFEQGKIFTACQGGGYQPPNLLPESFAANRSRNDTRMRKENSRGC